MPPLRNLSNKPLPYQCFAAISAGSFCILETKSQGSHTSKSFQQTPPKRTTAPKHIRMQRVHEKFPDTHAELNVNVWTIRDSTEIRRLFAIHLLLSFCIIFAHISMDSVYCLSVHCCDVLHYLCDTEVVHLKHQKNDKQPWFRRMHVKGGPSIQHGHFLCITISQGHYWARINTRKITSDWACHSRRNAGPILSCTMCCTPGPESTIINPALMCLT